MPNPHAFAGDPFNYYSEEVNCRTLGVSTYRSLSDSTVVAEEVETSTFFVLVRLLHLYLKKL